MSLLQPTSAGLPSRSSLTDRHCSHHPLCATCVSGCCLWPSGVPLAEVPGPSNLLESVSDVGTIFFEGLHVADAEVQPAVRAGLQVRQQ